MIELQTRDVQPKSRRPNGCAALSGDALFSDARYAAVAEWCLRIALAAGFLSAVADRFGLWGPPGAANVGWGTWNAFVNNVAGLFWYAPASFHEPLAWFATVAEVTVAVGLLVGWRLRWFAFSAGLLLLSFAGAMTVALGIKAPLDASVYAAAAGAFLLPVLAGADRGVT